MRQITLFSKKVNIPGKSDKPVTVKFKVGLLDFKLFLTHIEVGNITDAVSVTLTVNNTVYNTTSFTVEHLIVTSTSKLERIIMNGLFNQKTTEILISKIYRA